METEIITTGFLDKLNRVYDNIPTTIAKRCITAGL